MWIGNPQLKLATAGASVSRVTFENGCRGMTIFNIDDTDTASVGFGTSAELSAGGFFSLAPGEEAEIPTDVQIQQVAIVREGAGDVDMLFLYYGSHDNV
jgi:hypothetical protein